MADSPRFWRRPQPSEDDRKVIAERQAGRKFLTEPSNGWWERGALVVDDRGPALIDADGARRDFPSSVAGAWLIFNRWYMTTGNGAAEITGAFLAAPTEPHRVLLRLPAQGFEEADYQAFAACAGFTYGDTATMTIIETEKRYPGSDSRRGPSWSDAVFTREDLDQRVGARLKRRLSHPFGRGSS